MSRHRAASSSSRPARSASRWLAYLLLGALAFGLGAFLALVTPERVAHDPPTGTTSSSAPCAETTWQGLDGRTWHACASSPAVPITPTPEGDR